MNLKLLIAYFLCVTQLAQAMRPGDGQPPAAPQQQAPARPMRVGGIDDINALFDRLNYTDNHAAARRDIDALTARVLGMAENAEERTAIYRFLQTKEEQVRLGYADGEHLVIAAKWNHLIKLLREPKTFGALVAVGAGLFASWHATALAREVIGSWIAIPPLAQKTSIKSWTSKTAGLFIAGDEEDEPLLKDVILAPHLSEKIARLVQALTVSVRNGSTLRNLFFYGPPGTGKTMVALAMARESGLEYMYFSASKLEMFGPEEGLKQLARLYEYAKSYPKKLMIIIDEAEILFGNRDTMSDKTRKLLNLLLTYTGTESTHYMTIALSNKPASFDGASLSRFGEKIKIGVPAHEERKRLLAHYAQKYFIDSNVVKPDKRTFLQTLLSPKPLVRQQIAIAQETFSPQVMDECARQLDGCVGRDIADLMVAVQARAYSSQDHLVTAELLYEELHSKLQQKREEKEGFAN